MQNDNDINLKALAQRNGLLLPVVSNIVLLLVVLGAVWWLVSIYQSQIQTAAFSESRFVTMEWNLLQQLKAQTDGQLMEKDREIAALRRRYSELLERGGSAREREQLQEQLVAAEEDRRSIVQQRMDIAALPSPPTQVVPMLPGADPASSTAAVARAEGATALTLLLREQIDTLRTQVQELEGQVSHSHEAAESARRSLSQLGLLEDPGGSSPPADDRQQSTMELLRTRTLLRAIVTMPEIRAEYPELLSELERHFQTIEGTANLAGRQRAYREASAAVETLAAELDISLSASTSAETRNGYLERLRSLVIGVVSIGVPEV